MTFGAQNQTLETVPSSKRISKYILGHSRVILIQFPYVKIVFLMKIDEHHQKSTKMYIKMPVWGRLLGLYQSSPGNSGSYDAILSPILEILEIEVFNIPYNPANI